MAKRQWVKSDNLSHSVLRQKRYPTLNGLAPRFPYWVSGARWSRQLREDRSKSGNAECASNRVLHSANNVCT